MTRPSRREIGKLEISTFQSKPIWFYLKWQDQTPYSLDINLITTRLRNAANRSVVNMLH